MAIAHPLQATTLCLEILVGIGLLLLKSGQDETALPIFEQAIRHPLVTWETQHRAERLAEACSCEQVVDGGSGRVEAEIEAMISRYRENRV